MTATLLILVALLAFANGANDNCKGVATLVGYGAAKPVRALWWVMATTALGAAFSFWFAGGLVTSFSAGPGTRNDAPKIAALGVLVLGGQSGMAACFALVTVSMALGGMLAGRRVLETLAQKVTTLPLAESLTASLATAAMVGMASWNGLPVSTTHVSTGAIVGAGLRHDASAVKWGNVGEIALSWVVTLPAAALIAALVKLLVR